MQWWAESQLGPCAGLVLLGMMWKIILIFFLALRVGQKESHPKGESNAWSKGWGPGSRTFPQHFGHYFIMYVSTCGFFFFFSAIE